MSRISRTVLASVWNKPFLTENNKIILLNTLRKSGSIFLWNSLLNLTGYKSIRISGAENPAHVSMRNPSYIDQEKIKKYRHISSIAQDHIPATKENIETLEKYFSKIIVHVRDPRQSIISLFHYQRKLNEERQLSESDLDFSIELGQFLKAFFEREVTWIREWHEVVKAEKTSMKILFTRFEDMKANPDIFLNKIVEFYGLNAQGFQLDEFTGQGNHQRRGETSEWKRVMTEEQKAWCEEIMGQDMIQFFS